MIAIATNAQKNIENQVTHNIKPTQGKMDEQMINFLFNHTQYIDYDYVLLYCFHALLVEEEKKKAYQKNENEMKKSLFPCINRVFTQLIENNFNLILSISSTVDNSGTFT